MDQLTTNYVGGVLVTHDDNITNITFRPPTIQLTNVLLVINVEILPKNVKLVICEAVRFS